MEIMYNNIKAVSIYEYPTKLRADALRWRCRVVADGHPIEIISLDDSRKRLEALLAE